VSDEGEGGKRLTQKELETLLARLDPDRERAGARYLELHRKLVRLFEWRGAHPADELADETLDRAARRLTGGVELSTGDPFHYLRGIAFLIFKEVLRRVAAEQGALLAWRPPAPAADAEEERRLACLDRCLEALPPDQRQLALRYHAGGDRIRLRQQLGRELDLPLNSLRIRVHRLRKRLEDCLTACLAHP
jgi:DNA-directed RNA polymerase specialized sigma24 family protein